MGPCQSLRRVLGLLALSANIAHAQDPAFTPATYPALTGARDLVSVDLNRDGWLDVATANTGRNAVLIFINRGQNGGFDPPREIAVGTGPFDLSAGDVDRNGTTDLIVTTPDSRTIDVLLLGASGQLAARRILTGVGEPWGATLADVTGDGILDIVHTDYATHSMSVLRGFGDGTFTPHIIRQPVSLRPQGVAAGDFNHDGIADIAVASTGSSTLDVFYGTRSGGLTRTTIEAGRPLNVLAAADVDSDGWIDLAAVSSSTNVLVVLRGRASGFVLAGTRATGASPRGLAVGDLNVDGRLDVTTANYSAQSVTLLLGRADGGVLPDRWGDLPSATGARAVAVGDFDNDGRPDLAAGGQTASRLWVHDNSTFLIGGGFSFHSQAIAALGESIAAGDVNENGRTDLLGNGTVLLDGTTTVSLPTPAGREVYATLLVDYTRDGHQDAVLSLVDLDGPANPPTSQILLYAGDGRGHFAPPVVLAEAGCCVRQLRAGDVDRDGDLDIVFAAATTLHVLRSTAAGTQSSAIALGGLALWFELADLNRDGALDVLVSELTNQDYRLISFDGDGAGGFSPRTAGQGEVPEFALGDLNHDGRLDLVSSRGSIGVMLGEADGTFGPVVEYPVVPSFDPPNGVTLGDFTGDGDLDAFSASGSLLIGNGDGSFGSPAAFAVESFGMLALDWNRDGLIDVVTSGRVILNERRNVNRAPVADAGPDRTYTYREHLPASVYAGASYDPDLHRLTYDWRDASGTPLVIDEDRVYGYFAPRAPGTHVFTLTVRDGRGGEDTDTVSITILPEPEIVIHAAVSGQTSGRWTRVNDSTAASGSRLYYPNAGAAKSSAPAAEPADYVDIYFAADPTQTYKIWVRLKADGNNWANDSVWLQFSGAIDSSGRAVYAIGTTSGMAVNLEECSGCGVSGWGWEDDGWGARNVNGGLLRFPEGGEQRIRIQVREDGVSVDQIVLSAERYRSARPGTARGDTTILPASH